MPERFESYSQRQVPKVEMKGMKAETEALEQQEAKEKNEEISGFRAEIRELNNITLTYIKQKYPEQYLNIIEKTEKFA